MATEADTPKAKRLNPFAFPSETNVRFSILIITALMLAYGIGSSVGRAAGILQVPEWEDDWVEYLLFFSAPCGLMFSVLILAFAIYRSYPSRIRRAKNLRVIVDSDDPQFASAIQELVRVSGVTPPPSIEMTRGSQYADGQVFGFRDRYALRLGGRLRLLLRKNPAEFKAIVFHELGHIANADVTRTYFAQSIWIAFAILTAIPFISFIAYNFTQGLIENLAGGLTREELTRLFFVNVPTVLLLLLQFGCMLVFMAMVRGSLLRVREFYADWQAVLWGAGDSLAKILRGNSSEDKTGHWTQLWRLHPTARERAETLKYPDRLFRVKADVPFFIGALLGFVADSMYQLMLATLSIVLRVAGFGTELGEILIPRLSPAMNASPLISSLVNVVIYTGYYGMLLAFLVVIVALGISLAYTLMGALGLELQREVVAEMVVSQQGLMPYLRLWKPTVLFVLGFLLGYFLTPFSPLANFAGFINARGLTIVLMTFAIAGVMICLVWLGLVYIRFFARRMVGIHVGTSPSQRTRRLLTFFASGWFLIFFPPVVLWHIDVVAITGGQTIALTRWMTALIVVVIGSLTQYAIVFGVTWLLVQTYRLFRKPQCPSCNKITRKRYAVGEKCEHCRKDLAPWLFINDSPKPAES